MKTKKVSIIIGIIIVFFFVLFSFVIPSKKSMFKLHVINPIPSSVENIQHYKDRCGMHGPLFFYFKADSQDIKDIISKHELISVSRPMKVIDYLNDHIQQHIGWWKPAAELNNMEIYGKFLNPKSGAGDWHAKYLFIQGSEAFFVTTGFFVPEEYMAVSPSEEE